MGKTAVKIKKWIENNKVEFFAILFILLVASYFRFYRISEYLTFLGDEGRDVILVRRFLVNFDLMLIGPGTSIGNMYLGPLYYYFMAPSLFLAGYSPVGPAAAIAILGVITVWFVWFITREWFGKYGAVLASLLYAISPTVVIYSKSSWNPNIMPFFSLLVIYSLWKIYTTKKYFWLLIMAIAFAFVMQSHYLGLLLAPVIGIYWVLAYLQNKRKSKKFIIYSFFSLLIFLFLMSPLVIFDARHEWQNSAAIKKFFSERQTTVSARPWSALPNIWPLFTNIIERLPAGRSVDFGKWFSLVLFGGVLWFFSRFKNNFKEIIKSPYLLLIAWLGFALLGLGVYKQHIYDHYYGFIFAAPFILFGGISQDLVNKAKIRGIWLTSTAMVILVYFNLLNSPLAYPPNRQLQRTETVAKKIQEESGNERFNLAVLAERNYEDAYQYFLEKWGTKITDIDPQNYEATVARNLFVVCELPAEECDPTHSAKAEVANFGWSVIEDQWTIEGVTLYKLIHSDEL